MSRTPETLTAAERAAQLAGANTSGGGNPPARKVSVSEIRATAAAKHALSEPKPANAAAGMKVGDDFDGAVMQLPVKAMQPYDKNPRTGENPRYLQIKESIRAQGVTNQLSVTRRPGTAHYMPYAGGNTRLRAVHELLHETAEERFETLTVKYRAWPGDAAVIAAHLAENEQRGDTTYWEKAQGIASLKHELEKESQRVLTATEVNAEAKRLGMDFGLQTVQNFLFAVEHLQPIGKWLQARDVQHAIKPAVMALTALCIRLGQKSTTTRAAIDQGLTLIGETSAQAGEANKALDVEDLVRSLQLAVADSLGVSVAQLGNMLASLAASPSLTAQQLRATATAPTVPPPPASSPSADGAQPSEAPAPRASPSPALQAPSPPAAPPPQQMPLRPAILGPVPPAAPATQGMGVDRNTLDPNKPRELQLLIHMVLQDLSAAAELHDSVCTHGEMPLGFFMQLPETLHLNGSEPVRDVVVRKSAWHVLAAISGQFDAEVARRIPASHSRWGAMLACGNLGQQFMVCTAGQVFEGRAYLDAADLLRVFHHPELGPKFIELWDLALRMRSLIPQGFPDTWRPLSL